MRKIKTHPSVDFYIPGGTPMSSHTRTSKRGSRTEIFRSSGICFMKTPVLSDGLQNPSSCICKVESLASKPAVCRFSALQKYRRVIVLQKENSVKSFFSLPFIKINVFGFYLKLFILKNRI